MLGGSLQLNLTGFYYDYTGYQISEIVANSSVNLNINAKIYGVEFESIYSPFRNFTLNANVGYIHTRIDNGQSQIDQLNLNAGKFCLHPGQGHGGPRMPRAHRGRRRIYRDGSERTRPEHPVRSDQRGRRRRSGRRTTPYQFGLPENIGGNKLPNTPDFTVSAGAQYVFELPGDFRATLRGDYYWQDDSYARIFNAC